MKIRLADIAHARSGDKGDWVDFGLFAWDAAGYEIIAREVTADKVREHFRPWQGGEVALWLMPNILAIKIVLKGALQGGAARNLRQDNLGKAMAGALLRMEIIPQPLRGSPPTTQGSTDSGAPPHVNRGDYKSIFSAGLFKDQVIIVTGGGSGIGRCTAHELASLGAHVVLIGRSEDKLKRAVAEIEANGGLATYEVCDIRNEQMVKTVIVRTLAVHGRIHGLVNNAGGQYISPLASTGQKGWDAVVSSNLTGGFLMARECFVQSMQQHGGAIVNIVADMWGSMPGMGHSGAARAGMVSLTETAAAEWACCGVRVNAVAPGYIASSGMDHYPLEAGDMLRAMANTVPLGRFGNEAETSGAIVYLLSPAASFISGSVLRVDGARPQTRMGWAMQAPTPEAMTRDAVKPYAGFHLATTPKVFL